VSIRTILVIGAGGFVGQHLMDALRNAFPLSRILGASVQERTDLVIDITDRDGVRRVFSGLQPDACIHLAGISSISAARANPDMAWAVNLRGALNVAEAILECAPQCRLVFASSADCYGRSFNAEMPLDETAPLAPMNLYAATKSAADLALGALVSDGLRLLRLRPLNHTGPGQQETFVLPSFAGQIARIEAGLAAPEIAVGALDPERDFMDIRDVCAAYVSSVAKFDDIPENQIINIATGQAVRIGAVLEMMLAKSECKISVRQDPARMRRAEIPRIAANPSRALALLGWRPLRTLDETLESLLNYARYVTSLKLP